MHYKTGCLQHGLLAINNTCQDTSLTELNIQLRLELIENWFE